MSDVIGSKGTGGAEARCESEGGVWGVLARETSSPYLHAVSRFIHPEHEGFCSSHWHAHQNRGLGLASLSYGNTRMATYFDSSFLALNASISRLFVSPSRRHEDVGGSYYVHCCRRQRIRVLRDSRSGEIPLYPCICLRRATFAGVAVDVSKYQPQRFYSL